MTLVQQVRRMLRTAAGTPSRRTGGSVLLVVGSVGLAVLVHPAWFAAAAVAAVVAVRYPGPPGPGTGPGEEQTDREYRDIPMAITDVLSRYEADAILYFFRLMSDLPNFLSSADERATVEPFGLRLETRLTFRVTDGDSPTILVPVMQVSKGALLDELELTDGAGATVHRLSPYETRGLVGWALRSLVEFACSRAVPGGTPAPPQAVDELLRVVCRPHPWPDGKLTGRLDDVLGPLRLPDLWSDRLRRFCTSLAQSDLVVVEVDRPRGLGFDLTYRQLLTYESERSGKLWRDRLGLMADTVDAPPMVYVGRAQSYHFQIAPIAGRYVLSHVVERVHSRTSSTRAEMETSLGPIDLRYDGTAVRSHAHCYVTLLESPAARARRNLKDYKSVVEYRETPPGALGGVALASSATTVLTLVFALQRGDGSAEAPALLLALPAFMAIAIGHWFDTSRLPKSSVSAYLGMLGTMAVSVSGAVLYLLDRHRMLDWARVRPRACCGVGPLDTTVLWLGLAAFATSLTLYLWLRLAQGVRYYRRQQDLCTAAEPDLVWPTA